MPFALVVFGIILIVTGSKATYKDLGAAIAADFTGPNNFTWWLAAIGGIGALGYVETLKPFSRIFMVLVIVAMILSNKGFFAKLNEAIAQGPLKTATPDPVASAEPASGGQQSADSGGTGDIVATAVKFLPLLL